MLSPEGEIWQGLPEADGRFTQKIIWWSDDHNLEEEPRPTFTLTGRRLDRAGSFETGGPAGGGYRRDIGNFIMVGIEIPSGCWELTAAYRDAELSHVVLVDG